LREEDQGRLQVTGDRKGKRKTQIPRKTRRKKRKEIQEPDL
jgi:hypothetical protein